MFFYAVRRLTVLMLTAICLPVMAQLDSTYWQNENQNLFRETRAELGLRAPAPIMDISTAARLQNELRAVDQYETKVLKGLDKYGIQPAMKGRVVLIDEGNLPEDAWMANIKRTPNITNRPDLYVDKCTFGRVNVGGACKVPSLTMPNQNYFKQFPAPLTWTTR